MARAARHLRPASPPPADAPLGALEDMCEALEAGAGLPELVRTAARGLEASLAVLDPAGAVLAVAARSSSDERALLARAEGVESHELRIADDPVGRLLLRGRGGPPPPALAHAARVLIGAELLRVHGPQRASAEAAAGFLRAVLRREVRSPDEVLARGREAGTDLSAGATLLVARAHQRAPAEEGWRERMRAVAERGARAVAPEAVVALIEAGVGPTAPVPRDEVVLLVPGGEEPVARRVADAVARELEAGLHGFGFTVGRSRVARDPGDLHRAAHEALLAANVADAESPRAVLAFEETGAYKLLLATMTEDPQELHRFYAETLQAVVAYDEQYETDLVQTLETFLDADGNVAGTAQKLYTHRHTVRYRLERVRDLTGLDVGSSDGREKLSLGLKAMRVLGIPARRGPADEAGTEAGRVPRNRL